MTQQTQANLLQDVQSLRTIHPRRSVCIDRRRHGNASWLLPSQHGAIPRTRTATGSRWCIRWTILDLVFASPHGAGVLMQGKRSCEHLGSSRLYIKCTYTYRCADFVPVPSYSTGQSAPSGPSVPLTCTFSIQRCSFPPASPHISLNLHTLCSLSIVGSYSKWILHSAHLMTL